MHTILITLIATCQDVSLRRDAGLVLLLCVADAVDNFP